MFCQQNTYVFCHKTLYCFAIRLTIVITTSVRTVLQIIVSNTKDDLRPHRPPHLPLSPPYWRRRHRCHGCHVVAAIAIATVSSVIAAAFWLIVFPRAASATAAIACPRRCRCWLPTQLPLLQRPQTAARCYFLHNRCLSFNRCSPWWCSKYYMGQVIF